MKKILLMLAFVLVSLTVSATKNYNIIGVYHDAKANHPATWRVVTTDNHVGVHKLTLLPAQIREKRYEVKATKVADNLYMIEGKTFHAKVYIEMEKCTVKAKQRDVIMVIENIRGNIKGRLIFD